MFFFFHTIFSVLKISVIYLLGKHYCPQTVDSRILAMLRILNCQNLYVLLFSYDIFSSENICNLLTRQTLLFPKTLQHLLCSPGSFLRQLLFPHLLSLCSVWLCSGQGIFLISVLNNCMFHLYLQDFQGLRNCFSFLLQHTHR